MMTARQHINQCTKKHILSIMPSCTAMVVVVMVGLGWSFGLPGCAAVLASRDLHHGPHHQPSRSVAKMIGAYTRREPVSCPDDQPLMVENGNRCVAEDYCRRHKYKYVVHWMKRQCLSKCPPGYIYINGYCSFTDVCRTKRIVTLEKLRELKNCRIVEGSIEIVLIKDVSEDEWRQWSFPDLVEITDFLLVYQVEGLRNLGQLFPNLAVIRGMRLHQHYSLVIFGTHLQDIGLHNLRAILRGSVRIENNINLCYVHTVNWDAITNSSSDNVLTINSEPLCKNCCPSCSAGHSQDQHCRYCWNSTKGQQICRGCEHGCTSTNKCCHDQCVGGCQAPDNDRACNACRYYNTGNRCVKSCAPLTLLEYKGYRCVTRQYCQRKGFILFNGTQCVAECPEGYQPTRDGTEGMMACSKCESCGKSCRGLLVNTVARAQELQGCTAINGSLIISITYGKTVTKELQASLGSIQRVTQYVRIFKTSPLKSLNFLLSLKVIEGRKLYNNKYALFVHENENLEDIWDFTKKRELNITQGKIFFHANPRLCYNDKIEKLLSLTGQQEDFSMRFTNGDKVACSIMKQAIMLVPGARKGQVTVIWNPVSTNEDERKISGYFIYYKETNESDIQHMDGRDACNDEWKREHVEANDAGTRMEVELKRLKPYRRYAVYVETDTVADADIGARSNIAYTTTLPYNPSPPLELRVTDKGTSHLTVEWSPPSSPNGQVSEYIVSITLQEYEEETCQDFCPEDSRKPEDSQKDVSDSMVSQTSHVAATTTTTTTPLPPPPKCCSCPREPVPFEEDEGEFKNRLHNYVYLHRTRRGKRSTESGDEAPNSGHSFSSPSWIGQAAEYTEYRAGQGSSRSETYIKFTNLSHYSHYKIEVSACHEVKYNSDSCPGGMKACRLCSTSPAWIVETTAKKDNADVVVDLKVEDVSQSKAKVSWAPPVAPNGRVLGYKVFTSYASGDGRLLSYCMPSCQANGSQEHVDLENLMPATKYQVWVEAHTGAPLDINDTAAAIFFITEDEDGEGHGQMLLLVAIFLLLAIMCGIFVFRRIQSPKLPVDEEVDPVPDSSIISRQYLVDPANLRLETVLLGKGHFGLVFRGNLLQGRDWVRVAVKQAINQEDREDMLYEARLMLELNSYHILRAYGVMLRANHTYLVIEYMGKGDLLNYLREQRTALRTQEVCDMAMQIADGMAYLASRNYVHRDLAARNCLINDKMDIKISDFGMTRITEANYYYIFRSQLFPVRWIAPECFNKQRFTTQSDVWSYGIVLWEIITNGRNPYEELLTNDEVREKVSKGHTLKDNVQNSLKEKWLADLVCQCWEAEGHNRPSFPSIIRTMLPHASPHFLQHFRGRSFYHQSRNHD